MVCLYAVVVLASLEACKWSFFGKPEGEGVFNRLKTQVESKSCKLSVWEQLEGDTFDEPQMAASPGLWRLNVSVWLP